MLLAYGIAQRRPYRRSGIAGGSPAQQGVRHSNAPHMRCRRRLRARKQTANVAVHGSSRRAARASPYQKKYHRGIA